MIVWRDSHRVTYSLSEIGITVKFHCDEEGPEAWCRKVCAEGCEEWTDRHERETGHPWAYRSICTVEDWLNTSDPFDVYDGAEGVPVMSGPVQVRWECNTGYVWRQDPDFRTPTEELRVLREALRAVVIELEG